MLKNISMQSLTIAVLALSSVLAPGRASAASSSAFGIKAQFTVADLSTDISPFDFARGATQGATLPDYAKTVPLASVNDILSIAPGPLPIPALFVSATNLASDVRGAFGVDTFSSEGDTTLHTVNLSLNLKPLPPNVIPFEPFLAVSAGGVKSHAGFSDQVPRAGVAVGSASFGSLTVSGSLIGNQVLTFSGPAPKNKILYQSPTADPADVPAIVITLNKEIEKVVIACDGGGTGCVAMPVGIVTEALNISLHNANLHGHVVSGDIIVGYTSAQ